MAEDYYDILGVGRNASQREIESAYKKLALEFHPDRHMDNPLAHLAEERMKSINEAYSALKDPSSRRQYDSGGMRGAPPPSQPPPQPSYQPPQDSYYKQYHQADTGYAYTDDWGEQSEYYGADPARMRDLRDKALNLFNGRKYTQSINILDQILRLTPDDAGAHNLKAMAYIETGNYRGAIYSLGNSIRIEPNNAVYHFNRGACYVSMRNPRLAIRDIEKATNLDVDNPQYLIGLASALHMVGQHIRARSVADHAQSVNPDHPSVRMYMNQQNMRENMREQYYQRRGFSCGCCPGMTDCLCCAMLCDLCCIPGGCCVIR
ncbi:DnaJ domain-containing protein [bacterium]|nr:DnaJ domain-containing protein [bacterium]